MLLHVTHSTRYDYTPPVAAAQHLAHLKPMDTVSQRLVSHALTISPTPTQRNESPDVYGNARAFFALESTHEELVVTAESVVDRVRSAIRPPDASTKNTSNWNTTSTIGVTVRSKSQTGPVRALGIRIAIVSIYREPRT